MAIDVEIQDESGNTLEKYEGPSFGLPLLKLASFTGPCLRFVLPWADATFNSEQVKELRAELAHIVSASQDQSRTREARALLEFVARAEGPHTYVKFIGD